MGIDKIIDYPSGWSRDKSILGDQVFDGEGIGCDTVWFSSVKAAERAFKAWIAQPGHEDDWHRAMNGHQAGLCAICGCHYGNRDAGYGLFPDWQCHTWKDAVARGDLAAAAQIAAELHARWDRVKVPRRKRLSQRGP